MTLRQARESLEWSQQELVDRIDKATGTTVSQQTLSLIELCQERGEPITSSHDTIVAIVATLKRAGLRSATIETIFPAPTARAAR